MTKRRASPRTRRKKAFDVAAYGRADGLLQQMRSWDRVDAYALERVLTDYVATPEYRAGITPEPHEIGIPTYEMPWRPAAPAICMDSEGTCLSFGMGTFQTISIYELLYMLDEGPEDFALTVVRQLAKLVSILDRAAAIDLFRAHHGLAEMVYEFTTFGFCDEATEVMAGLDTRESAKLLQHPDKEVRLAIIRALGRLNSRQSQPPSSTP